jgi:hypothetical protein
MRQLGTKRWAWFELVHNPTSVVRKPKQKPENKIIGNVELRSMTNRDYSPFVPRPGHM